MAHAAHGVRAEDAQEGQATERIDVGQVLRFKVLLLLH